MTPRYPNLTPFEEVAASTMPINQHYEATSHLACVIQTRTNPIFQVCPQYSGGGLSAQNMITFRISDYHEVSCPPTHRIASPCPRTRRPLPLWTPTRFFATTTPLPRPQPDLTWWTTQHRLGHRPATGVSWRGWKHPPL